MTTRGLRQRRWFPSHQPQTLQIAVALLYWNAAIGLLVALLVGGLGRLELILLAADVAGGYGVANERRWGYVTALVAAFLPFVLLFVVGGFLAGGILNLIFEIALVVLLLHPMSRNYYKTWFR
jgi:hypothetical protein